MSEQIVDNRVISWIEKYLKEQQFRENCIEIENGGNTGGYLANIIFAKLVGTTSKNQREEVHIIVKYNSEESIEFLRLACQREVFIYDRLLPLFRKFQTDKNVIDMFNSVPKRYQALSAGDQDILVLENLKKRGYQLHNKRIPMDLHHQKLVLGEYAKFHALSFALRDQGSQDFEKLTPKLRNIAKLYFEEPSTEKAMIKYTKLAGDILRRRNELELAGKLDEILLAGPTKVIIQKVLNADVDESVVTHGDCWNNNFMFKYENNGTKPCKLAIIDWQLSSMHSPVLDLSLFLYCVSSEEELSHFEELLLFYHSSFSTFLRKVGSDPEKIFPYSKLKEHWQKYSIFAMVWLVTFLRIILSGEEEESEGTKEDMFDLRINDKDEFENRLVAVIKHYFTFKFVN